MKQNDMLRDSPFIISKQEGIHCMRKNLFIEGILNLGAREDKEE